MFAHLKKAVKYVSRLFAVAYCTLDSKLSWNLLFRKKRTLTDWLDWKGVYTMKCWMSERIMGFGRTCILPVCRPYLTDTFRWRKFGLGSITHSLSDVYVWKLDDPSLFVSQYKQHLRYINNIHFSFWEITVVGRTLIIFP